LELVPRQRTEVAPGAVLVPDWLTLDEQRRIAAACDEWAEPPAGRHVVRTPGGGQMSVEMACLGWHWLPYRYTRVAEDVDGAPVKPLPSWLAELAQRAVAEVGGVAVSGSTGGEYVPDVALVNYYGPGARMGMHQDRDEVVNQPVVSLSVGETCTFRFGNTENRSRPWHDVEVRSGDLFVFGGPSRFAYHGVPKVVVGSAPPGCGLDEGRLNITVRMTGLPG
jgi:alkylated DNA repair protein (DNA oxidative demethylase)